MFLLLAGNFKNGAAIEFIESLINVFQLKVSLSVTNVFNPLGYKRAGHYLRFGRNRGWLDNNVVMRGVHSSRSDIKLLQIRHHITLPFIWGNHMCHPKNLPRLHHLKPNHVPKKLESISDERRMPEAQ